MKFMDRSPSSCTFEGDQIAHEPNCTNVGACVSDPFIVNDNFCSHRLIPSLFQYISGIIKPFANVVAFDGWAASHVLTLA